MNLSFSNKEADLQLVQSCADRRRTLTYTMRTQSCHSWLAALQRPISTENNSTLGVKTPPAIGRSPAPLTVFSFHLAIVEMGQVSGDARK